MSIKKLNIEQKSILDYIKTKIEDDDNKPCQVLIQGAAGTGKSFLINEIKEMINENGLKCIIGTHQAIAASIIGGYTLYKIFGFFGQRDVARVNKNGIKYTLVRLNNKYKIKNCIKDWCLQEYKNFHEEPKKNWLIIDEISMIGLEFLDDMDNVLQELFGINLPFGGINLIFSGHFAQLKPVKEIPIFRLKLDHFIKHVKLFELKINQRQTNQEFFDLCNSVMKGCLKSEQKKILKSRLIQNFKYSELIDLVHIFPTKKLCNEHNFNRLLSLNEDIYYFLKSTDTGDSKILSKEEKNIFNGLYNYIIFCKNSKIMITVNEHPFINGELYNIENVEIYNEITESEFFKDLDYVKTDISLIKNKILKKNKIIKYIKPEYTKIVLRSSNQLCNNKDKEIVEIGDKLLLISTKNVEITNLKKETEIVFQRQMFPFQLAWAVTTHKIQGISLDEGVIDMGESNFDPVQLYVNISRIKSLEKLYIKDLKLPLPVSPDKKLIKNFIKEIKENNENNTDFNINKNS